MAETAAILSPEKTVLLPEKTAGCPMADMITAEQLRDLKVKFPDAIVVCYVNSAADVKAESDYCCTSSNAVAVVESLPADKKILFVPDKNLGSFVAEKTGRDIELCPGYCTTHVCITEDDIHKAREKYPDAIVMSHPECTEQVRQVSDELLSTGQMLKFVKNNSAKRYIIATEKGIIHALEKENPNAEYIPATERAICPNMKKITIDKVIASLEEMKEKVVVEEEIRTKAKKTLDRMVGILPSD
jgi:quinolinate synthase